jgi:hypothetical protein
VHVPIPDCDSVTTSFPPMAPPMFAANERVARSQ